MGSSAGPAAWLSPPHLDPVPLSHVGVGDQVLVWSNTASAWITAVVSHDLPNGELVVSYRDNHGRAREKELPRNDQELRPYIPGPGGG